LQIIVVNMKTAVIFFCGFTIILSKMFRKLVHSLLQMKYKKVIISINTTDSQTYIEPLSSWILSQSEVQHRSSRRLDMSFLAVLLRNMFNSRIKQFLIYIQQIVYLLYLKIKFLFVGPNLH